LEALKSRNLIRKREALLLDSGIDFGPVIYAKPTDEEIESAKPRWFNLGSKTVECEKIVTTDKNEPFNEFLKPEEELEKDTKRYQEAILEKLATIQPARPLTMPPKSEIDKVIVVESDSELDISEVSFCPPKEPNMSGREVAMFDMSMDEIDKQMSPKKSPPMPPCSTPVYRDIVFTPKHVAIETPIQPRKILMERNQPSILVKEKSTVLAEEKKVKFQEPKKTPVKENQSLNDESADEKMNMFKKPAKSVIVRKIIIPSKTKRVPENK
jgi:hypothetical protein